MERFKTLRMPAMVHTMGFEPFAISLYQRENLEVQGEKKDLPSEPDRLQWLELKIDN